MADNRADRFDRADFASRGDHGAAKPASLIPKPPSLLADAASPLPPPPTSISPQATAAAPSTQPQVAASTPAALSWRRSELRPDDQIVTIVDSGQAPAAPLIDDARTGFVLRDGDSNRVILIDTGPAPVPRFTEGTAVPLVQGSPVALAQGTAVPMATGQAVPLTQGMAVPAAQDSSALSVIKQVLSNPALLKAASSALSSANSDDGIKQPDGEDNSLSTTLSSVLGSLGSS